MLIRSAIYATTVVLGQGFDAEAVAAALRDSSESITLVSVVATMLERMLDAGLRDPPTLRWRCWAVGQYRPDFSNAPMLTACPLRRLTE